MSEPGRSNAELPAAVRDALQRGRLVEAIKLMRTASGLSLKDVKDALEAYQRGAKSPAPAFPAPAAGGPLPNDVVQHLQAGNKIEAIRRLREQTGLGLKEAKDAVDAFAETHPQLPTGDLSPGEVRSSGSAWWWAVALALACILGYWLLRR